MKNLNTIAKLAINELRTAGADHAQCTVTEKEVKEFNVDGGEFSLFRTLFDNNISMTAIKDLKRGSVNINRFDEETVKAAVADCIQVTESGHKDDSYAIAPKQENKEYTLGQVEPDVEKFFTRTKELLEDIKKNYPKIIMEQMIVDHVKLHRVYLDSNETKFDIWEGQYEISLMFSGHEGEKASSFFGTGVCVDNLDRPFIELGSIKKDLEDVEKQIDTIPASGKFTGTAIIAPGCLGEVMYMIRSNFASDGVLIDGTSIWKDQIGKKVADDRITISFKPYDDRVVCGERYTPDGFISEDYDMIKDGVLESFCLSLSVANKTGNQPAKNASFNVVVKNGDTSIADIIKNTKKGIIVGRFSGGQPGTNGDFSGVAKNSFLVEDGKIVGAVSETMINGNLAELLNHVEAISSETVEDGMAVLPYIAFSGVVISGK